MSGTLAGTYDGPRPGIVWGCVICARTDVHVVEREVRRPHVKGRGPAEAGRVVKVVGDEAVEIERTLVCPCCSFDGCPHPKRGPQCEYCGRPRDPGWATQCTCDLSAVPA